jgi:ElaB/YqjD/DUF883 family membrane-anchored ribosome-binding protein
MNTEGTKEKPSAEQLLKDTARNVTELASIATHQLEDSLSRSKAKLQEMQSILSDKSKIYARETDRYIHENPWNAIGIAAGAGLIIGLLIRRS